MHDHEAARESARAAYISVNEFLDVMGAVGSDHLYDAAAHLLGYLDRIARDV